MATKFTKNSDSEMELEILEKTLKRRAGEDLPSRETSSPGRRKRKDRKERRTLHDFPSLIASGSGDRAEETDSCVSRCESVASVSSLITVSKDKYEEFNNAEGEIISFCLNPENGITPEQSEYIIKRLTAMSAAFSVQRGENITLRRQAAESKRICKQIEKSVITKMSEIKDACSSHVIQPTYAEKVKVKSLSVPQSMVKSPRNVVTVYPAEGTLINTSDQTKERVMGSIKPVTEKLKIRNLRKIRNNGVLIETETREDLTLILKSKKLEEAGLKAGLPNKLLPRIIIYDVPRELGVDSLAEAIHSQNADSMDRQTFSKEFKLIFKTGNKKKEVVNWVAEVSPCLRKLLISKNRVFVDWRSCNIQDFINLTRCYKCQSFGHIAKYCKATYDTCGHCGEDGHNFGGCPKKDKPEVCVHCKRIKKPDTHSSRARSCPVYTMALEQYLNKINYGEHN